MKPLDPRLLRYAKSSRGFVLTGVALGIVQALAIVGVAWAISRAVTGAIAGETLDELAGALWLLLACVAVRALAQWGMEWAGARAAAKSKSQLRGHLMRSLAHLGPSAGMSFADATTLASHGLEALDSYFAKYLPQLLLTAIAMPLLIIITFFADPQSAITEVVTLPIIPVFMVLIGWYTQRVQRAQYDALTRLSEAFLEIVEGLSTLKIFGRAERQRTRIREITDGYRMVTMRVLRVTFLSGFALELFASLAVALVAVQIGIRLIDRDMTLFVGLFALILAPEVFAPLRQVGAQFHAAAEGVEASNRVFSVIERAEAAHRNRFAVPLSERNTSTEGARKPAHDEQAHDASAVRPDRKQCGALELRGVTVRFDDRVVLDLPSFTAAAGEITAIAGESGAGKSTLLNFIRGEVAGSGMRLLGGREISAPDAAGMIAWMGQSAGLIEGSVRENVALGAPELGEERVLAALRCAGAEQLDPKQQLGVGGSGLSGGQAQRVALARALARAHANGCPIALFDEPTSALDSAREATVIAALRSLADEGRVVVVVSHRRQVLAAADRVVDLSRAEARQ